MSSEIGGLYYFIHTRQIETLPGFRLMCWHTQNKHLKISTKPNVQNKFSYSMIMSDKACESYTFSSLPTLTYRPIMCAVLIMAPVDWTINRPIVLACNFTTYFIHIFVHVCQSDSTVLLVMSLRQLRHDECRCRKNVFCWERAKRSIHV